MRNEEALSLGIWTKQTTDDFDPPVRENAKNRISDKHYRAAGERTLLMQGIIFAMLCPTRFGASSRLERPHCFPSLKFKDGANPACVAAQTFCS